MPPLYFGITGGGEPKVGYITQIKLLFTKKSNFVQFFYSNEVYVLKHWNYFDSLAQYQLFTEMW